MKMDREVILTCSTAETRTGGERGSAKMRQAWWWWGRALGGEARTDVLSAMMAMSSRTLRAADTMAGMSWRGP